MRRAVALMVVVLGCSKPPGAGRALVHVVVEPTVRADCVGVSVASTGVAVTALEPRGREHTFMLTQGQGLEGEVRLVARGYLGDCAAPRSMNAESAPGLASFAAGASSEVTLTLDGALDDSDADGYRASSAGGVDCDDGDPGVAPGQTELCSDGKDNDCSGAADCGDPSCAAAACDDRLACTAGDVCADGVCRGAAQCAAPPECMRSLGCGADGGCQLARAAAGFACDGGFCREDGTCIPPGQEWSCSNGLDDDGDTQIDCGDSECVTVACDDGRACTVNDMCTPDLGCGGTIECTSPPPGACWTMPGGCGPGGGCEYLVATGASCDDGQACTHADTCVDDGGCVGRPYSCGAGSCFSGGACQGDGGCTGAPLTGTACDDGDACTAADLCSAGSCLGTYYSCPETDCTVGFCAGDGGCGLSPKPAGTVCTGGTCDARGTCDVPLWQFAPSNFAVSQIPDGGYSDPVVFDAGCDAVFDSTDGGFTGWCGARPTPLVVPQLGGGPELVLLPMKGLVVAAGARIRFVGALPVALAITGDAIIEGELSASSDATRRGAGADGPACGTSTGTSGGVETVSMRGGGGGGGSFSTPGSHGAGLTAATTGRAGAAINASLRPLRGGCSGGSGAAAVTANAGRGGSGGGALQVSVAGTLVLYGTISASGAGGRPGLAASAGAGGGGSGGALLLEAGTVNLVNGAALSCSGGGGGEGSNATTVAGVAGADGMTVSAAYAPGGSGGSAAGGDGANGAALNVDAGSVNVASCGAGAGGCGAGGGGLGRLRIEGAFNCSVDNPTISASVLTLCP